MAKLNFLDDRVCVEFLAPLYIRIAIKTEEKEHHQVELLLHDTLVVRMIWNEPGLLEHSHVVFSPSAMFSSGQQEDSKARPSGAPEQDDAEASPSKA